MITSYIKFTVGTSLRFLWNDNNNNNNNNNINHITVLICSDDWPVVNISTYTSLLVV